MALPHPVSDELAELIARRFRVLAEPMRIRMLDALRQGESSVTGLTAAVDGTQQNVSKHLGVLLDAGVVSRRKDGNHVRYAIADDSIFALCEQVCGSLERQLMQLGAVVSGARS